MKALQILLLMDVKAGSYNITWGTLEGLGKPNGQTKLSSPYDCHKFQNKNLFEHAKYIIWFITADQIVFLSLLGFGRRSSTILTQ